MSSSTEHLHPVEVLLVLFLFSLEAVVALAVAVLALVLVVTHRDSQQQVPGPSIHPLHTLADDLHSLPSRELMLLAGTRSRLAKHRLVDLVLAF